MIDSASGSSQSDPAIPPDNSKSKLSVINPDSPEACHISVVGDTYTILISGRDTDGRYCLIDMLIPTGGGPGPHRHDFEEMFSILEGEIELTFRGQKSLAKAGTTVNIPANAPQERCREASTLTLHVLAGWPGGVLFSDRVGSSRAARPLRLNSARKNRTSS
jgi:quercetin dioxygenase-like cupin family protein